MASYDVPVKLHINGRYLAYKMLSLNLVTYFIQTKSKIICLLNAGKLHFNRFLLGVYIFDVFGIQKSLQNSYDINLHTRY